MLKNGSFGIPLHELKYHYNSKMTSNCTFVQLSSLHLSNEYIFLTIIKLTMEKITKNCYVCLLRYADSHGTDDA